MLKIDVFNIKGKKEGQVNLPKEVFGAKINQALMAQAVKVYLSNQRQAPAQTKRRGEIRASGRKIYRQKGTGRARHGDIKAPIFVKGAKAHGPTGRQNYQLNLSRQMRRKALFSALTSKLENKEVMVVGGLAEIKPKTKIMAKIIDQLINKSTNQQINKSTIILPQPLENILRAGRNIAGLDIREAVKLNTYQVLNGGRLIFMKESLAVLEKTFVKKR